MKTTGTKTAFTTVLLLLLIFVTYAVYAAPPENQSHFFKSRYLISIFNFFIGLELTPEQQNALQELLTGTHSELKPLLEDMHALRTEMYELVLAEEIDTVLAEKQIQDLASLKSDMTTIVLKAQLEGARILTPEQRETILTQEVAWKQRFLYWRTVVSKLFFN